MGLFDSLKSIMGNKVNTTINKTINTAATKTANTIKSAAQTKTETFTFEKLPETLEELQALPEAALQTPFQAAALTVLALAMYPNNKDICFAMLDFIQGPGQVTARDSQFYADRFRGKDYIMNSYFEGATPANNYTPAQPFTVKISTNPYSFQDENYALLFIKSGGADSPRQVKLRAKPSAGQWFLWEQFLLSDIRIPVAQDAWA